MVFVNVMVIAHTNEPPRSLSGEGMGENIVLTIYEVHTILRRYRFANHHDSLGFLGDYYAMSLVILLYQGGSGWLFSGGLPVMERSLCRHWP